MYQYIDYKTENRIATVTLNRPEKKNALNAEMVKELYDVFNKAEEDDKVKVVLLKAKGDVFCAGADLEYLNLLMKNSYEENLADSSLLARLMEKISTNRKVVVSQIEGSAIAGGCGLATVCDFSFATPECKFGYTEARIGFVPAIVMIFLIRKVGDTRAKELMLTGKLIDAEHAEKISLITGIVPKESINGHVSDFINGLMENSSTESMSTIKEMMYNLQSTNISNALNYASEMNAKSRLTYDFKKGISSFIKKEKIKW
jgi:methylglutaconyl-CoA hydratase